MKYGPSEYKNVLNKKVEFKISNNLISKTSWTFYEGTYIIIRFQDFCTLLLYSTDVLTRGILERDQIYLAVVNMQFLGEIEYWIQYCHNNNNNNDDNEISNLGIYFAL